LLVAVMLLVRLWRQPDRRVVRAAAVVATVVIVGLLPWMILKYQTYGTPLFPFLGKGNHWTKYYTPPDDATSSAWRIFLRENHGTLWGPAGALVLTVALLAVPASRKRLPAPEWAAAIGCGVAWFVSTPAMSLAGGGFDVARYVWPFVVITVPLSFAVTWKLLSTISGARWRRAAVLGWCLVLGGWLWLHERYTTVYLFLAVTEDLKPGLPRYPIATPELHESAQRLQARIPAGAPVLLRVAQPYSAAIRSSSPTGPAS
jgi:hypothetical protein